MDNGIPRIGLQIRAARALRGLNRLTLAELAGLTPSAIGKIELGKRDPRESTLQNIQAALGIRFDDPAVQAAFHVLNGSDSEAEPSAPAGGSASGSDPERRQAA